MAPGPEDFKRVSTLFRCEQLGNPQPKPQQKLECLHPPLTCHHPSVELPAPPHLNCQRLQQPTMLLQKLIWDPRCFYSLPVESTDGYVQLFSSCCPYRVLLCPFLLTCNAQCPFGRNGQGDLGGDNGESHGADQAEKARTSATRGDTCGARRQM